jgi:hypothetical protein
VRSTPRDGAIIFSDLVGKLDAVRANFRKLSANSIISGKLWGVKRLAWGGKAHFLNVVQCSSMGHHGGG